MLLAALVAGASAALAYRAPEVHPLSPEEEWLPPGQVAKAPGGQVEGACGLAISPLTHGLYVSDYYHRAVHTFSLAGLYGGTQSLPGGDPRVEINRADAACGLAADAAGNLYANEFHQSVFRLAPGELLVDSGKSTGVAVGAGGDVYVNDRTYVAVYDAPVEAGEAAAATIGLGSLGDAYGLAVDAAAGRVYVPDAASETIEVFEPAISLSTPVDTIAGPPGIGFNSLSNAALAVDPSPTGGEGHLLVVDNLKPLFQDPEAAVYEFDDKGEYLDRLQVREVVLPNGAEGSGPVFGEPSGIAVDPASGDLFVTTGNSEHSNVLKYGPYQAVAPPAPPSPGEGSAAAPGGARAHRRSPRAPPLRSSSSAAACGSASTAS
jgi:DNA-binding beta-propeller fold protein YncE